MKKSILIVFAVAIFCVLGFSQNVRFDGIALTRGGQPAPGATIAVCTQPANTGTQPCTPAANLCASLTDTGCTGSNIVHADGLGNYFFYIPAGSTPYTLQFYGPGLGIRIQPDQTYGNGSGSGGSGIPDPLSVGNLNVANNTNLNGFNSTGPGTWNSGFPAFGAPADPFCGYMVQTTWWQLCGLTDPNTGATVLAYNNGFGTGGQGSGSIPPPGGPPNFNQFVMTTDILPSSQAQGAMTCWDPPTGVFSFTPPCHIDTVPCSSLNSGGLTDAGCFALFNSIILQSLGSTDDHRRHTFNTYLESDLRQPCLFGCPALFYPFASSMSVLLGPASNLTQAEALGGESILTISDLASSGVTLVTPASGHQTRVILNPNTHVTTVYGYHTYVPFVDAGAVLTNLVGYGIDAPTGTGTITNSVAETGTGYQYGSFFGGTIAATVFSDASVGASGACHGALTLPATAILHDCWYGGTGSPNGVVTAKIGSFYSRQDGGIASTLYLKETGTGNTGWDAVPALIASGTASMPTGSLATNTCATAVSVTATGAVTTDSIKWSYNAAPGSTNGLLTITPYPTIDHVNFLQCNPTSATQVPASGTINFEVIR